jgi:hypothetical protein
MTTFAAMDPRNSKALGHILNINGTNQNPDKVDMSTVFPTIDLNMSGFAKHNIDINYKSLSVGTVGLVAPYFFMGHQLVNYGVAGQFSIGIDIGYNARMYPMSSSVVMSGTNEEVQAWVIANAGKVFFFDWLLYLPNRGTSYCLLAQEYITIKLNTYAYASQYRSPSFFVPAGSSISCNATVNNAILDCPENFPTTTKLWTHTALYQTPIGAPAPALYD